MAGSRPGLVPQVRRVGFDHGWRLLGPTFLNFGRPLLLIDRAFLDPSSYGLEVFGDRDPHVPLPMTTLTVEHSGRFVGIHDASRPDDEPLVIGALADPVHLAVLAPRSELAIAIGDTWEAQLTWAAFWTFAIGISTVRTPHIRCLT